VKGEERFKGQAPRFWANVRTITQQVGYTTKGIVRTFSFEDMTKAMADLGLAGTHLVEADGLPTVLGQELREYFDYRAELLNEQAANLLMDEQEAREQYEELRATLSPTRPPPMNKQKAAKKAPAYLTAMVNMLIESCIGDYPCNYDPLELTTFTKDQAPARTLARRVDGAFPSPVNPVALWEIKEYYYTTTFGSRIADGVYETLLDGMELQELATAEEIEALHYFIIDARDTWWSAGGRPYLCRIVDMLHMGFVDEVLLGREIKTRLPELVSEWIGRLEERGGGTMKGATSETPAPEA